MARLFLARSWQTQERQNRHALPRDPAGDLRCPNFHTTTIPAISVWSRSSAGQSMRSFEPLATIFGSGIPASGTMLGKTSNRLSRRRLTTIFLVCPASPKYVSAVTFRRYAARARRQPRFVGVYSPGPGQWGLVLAVSSPEEVLVNPENTLRLQAIVETLERIRNRVGAESVALSGTLPSFLREITLRNTGHEREQTAAIVEQAIYLTLTRVRLRSCHLVILLGIASYIGSAVYSRLQNNVEIPRLLSRPNLQRVTPSWFNSSSHIEINLRCWSTSPAIMCWDYF